MLSASDESLLSDVPTAQMKKRDKQDRIREGRDALHYDPAGLHRHSASGYCVLPAACCVLNPAASFSAMAMTGRLVLARTMTGIIEASMT
jgi:hypothetical protein